MIFFEDFINMKQLNIWVKANPNINIISIETLPGDMAYKRYENGMRPVFRLWIKRGN